jgi:hypothetical protein
MGHVRDACKTVHDHSVVSSEGVDGGHDSPHHTELARLPPNLRIKN